MARKFPANHQSIICAMCSPRLTSRSSEADTMLVLIVQGLLWETTSGMTCIMIISITGILLNINKQPWNSAFWRDRPTRWAHD
jgi:hypothetical protein